MAYIPIFIIVHNQLDILKKSVASYEKFIETPIKIIFHDVATSYKPTLDYLEERKRQGYKVYRSEINNHHTVINSIKDYYKNNPEFEYYVMTDPDIELDNSPGDILKIYTELLNKYKCLSVGPMLRINDIPDYYPGKKVAIRRHTSQFWSKPKYSITLDKKEIKFIKCMTDTTFQLCNIKYIPPRFPHKNSIRVCPPYSARHLDWYIDPNNLTPCQLYYQNNTTKISHWNNPNFVKGISRKISNNNNKMENLLVTGGCGFIGSNFINHIATKKIYNIINLDAMYYAADKNNINKEIQNSEQYTLVEGNLCSATL